MDFFFCIKLWSDFFIFNINLDLNFLFLFFFLFFLFSLINIYYFVKDAMIPDIICDQLRVF